MFFWDRSRRNSGHVVGRSPGGTLTSQYGSDSVSGWVVWHVGREVGVKAVWSMCVSIFSGNFSWMVVIAADVEEPR